MPANTSVTPGWYPDGSGSQRYWDGSAWTDHTAVLPATAAHGGAAAGAAAATRVPSRKRRHATTAGVGVLGLILGLVFGNAGDGGTATELAETQAELTTTTTELEEQSALLVTAQEERDTAEGRVIELELAAADGAEAAQATADLEVAQTTRTQELDTRETDLAAREAAVGTRETEVGTREVDVTTREETVTTREASVPAQRQAAAPAAPAPAAVAPAPSNVYFKNCDAARAAGAAPVRVGDPGYGTHLDRDRDGVGCE